jgi:hypothetical protein
MAEEISAQPNAGQLSETPLHFVKICFTSPSSGQRGVAVIRFNPTTKLVEKIDSMVSNSSQYIDNISTMSPVVNFLDFLTQKRFRMDFIQKVTSEVNGCIKQGLEGDNPMNKATITNDMIRFIKEGDTGTIKAMLLPHLMRALYDKKLDIDIGVESTTQTKIDAYFKEQQNAENSAATASPSVDEFFNVGDGNTLLDCFPVLSPVSGIAINKITPGIDIMVKVDNTSPQGNKFNKLFNLISEDGKVSPKEGTVENMKIDGNTYKLLIKFANNVYGKIVETEIIKVKLHQESVTKEVKSDSKMGLYITIALGAGLFVALIVLFLIATK